MENSMTNMTVSPSTSNMMGMSDMMMVFFTATTTPLYSSSWVPTSVGQYAGTCIFLIVLGALFRGLFALKAFQEQNMLDAEMNRRYVIVTGDTLKDRILQDSSKEKLALSANGIEEDVVVVQRKTSRVQPWRFSTDGPRAILDTVIVGVGYLLMLAVMTMNLGYFLSVLGGAFLGSLAFGHKSALSVH